MCEHCGCRGVQPLAELMDEHFALLELGGDVRRHLVAGDRAAALTGLEVVGRLLDRHVGREERGVFTALKEQGDFVEAVEELEAEHLSFDAQLAALDASAADFGARVEALLVELSLHIDKENLGIFPVAVVTLGARGWETVGKAHDEEPSFLTGDAAAVVARSEGGFPAPGADDRPAKGTPVPSRQGAGAGERVETHRSQEEP